MSISCHVLDTTLGMSSNHFGQSVYNTSSNAIPAQLSNKWIGKPASSISVRLRRGDDVVAFAYGQTDSDGRVKVWKDVKNAPLQISSEASSYTIVFSTGSYFEKQGIEPFFPVVEVSFLAKEGQGYHIPLLLSPFSYSTYRGS